MSNTYRKKPVEIKAMQYRDVRDLAKLKEFTGESLICDGILDTAWEVGKGVPYALIQIKTLEGNMSVAEGNWVIKGVAGEFYPCRDDIFQATYESV